MSCSLGIRSVILRTALGSVCTNSGAPIRISEMINLLYPGEVLNIPSASWSTPVPTPPWYGPQYNSSQYGPQYGSSQYGPQYGSYSTDLNMVHRSMDLIRLPGGMDMCPLPLRFRRRFRMERYRRGLQWQTSNYPMRPMATFMCLFKVPPETEPM